MGIKKKTGILLDEKSLRRRYPDSNLAAKIYIDADGKLRLPSRNLALNHHLGGGIQYGGIIEIAGEESTGKTLMAIDFAVACQALGGMVLWDDAEASFDGRWAQRHGLDLKRLEILPYENQFEIVSDWIADMCVYYRSKLTKNEPILLVVDSVALMETEEAMETAEVDTKAEMGRRSFNMGKLLRKRNKIFAKYGICVIFINQMREKVGASQYEEKTTTPLQQSIKFFAQQRIWLFRGKRIRKNGAAKGQWVGNLVYVRTQKNKTSAPRDPIKAEVYFVEDRGNFGYHKYHGFEQLLIDKKYVKRVKGAFYYKEELIAKQNKKENIEAEEALRIAIANDPKIRAIFIKKLGINTISTTRKRLEEMDKNLYPVKQKAKSDAQEEDENS